jgi:hydroxymethylglutaryl-CoA lyase
MKQQLIKLIECPRDAMQGWPHFIPTQKKIEYINALLKVGFDTIDFGSFVSPKAIPQMADTKEVVGSLQLTGSRSKLLAIIANQRGAEDAVVYDEITYLGFPFSVSETFQLRNTNSTIDQSLSRVEEIQNLCIKNKKELVVYISMGFGNPYGDVYNEEIVFAWVNKLVDMPSTEIGVHLHSTPISWKEKVDAALQAGCKRFDGALKGIGGCPMADDELVGNMDTELMIPYFAEKNLLNNLNKDALKHCSMLASEIFV